MALAKPPHSGAWAFFIFNRDPLIVPLFSYSPSLLLFALPILGNIPPLACNLAK
jgi:hypothetical protein